MSAAALYFGGVLVSCIMAACTAMLVHPIMVSYYVPLLIGCLLLLRCET